MRDWKTYFDYVGVDACKPVFFSDGTIMRQVDCESGALKLGTHTGKLRKGQVYSGGNLGLSCVSGIILCCQVIANYYPL